MKIYVYNMTPHLSLGNNVYFAIGPEIISGRWGNDIASVVHQILKRILSSKPRHPKKLLFSIVGSIFLNYY